MLELHRLLLGDAARNHAFAKALNGVIVPGQTTIADIGSGTGFLSFLAEKYGARECFLYERNSAMLALSRKTARENGMKRCRFNAGHSTEVANPPKVDVIASETLGNWAYEENIIETMNDARRFLKPGGIMIPQELRCFVAPVTSPRLYDELNIWDRIGHGLKFTAARETCMNNMYVKDIVAKDLLGNGEQWDVVDFRKHNSSIRNNAVAWIMPSTATIYGFACWWEALLVKGVSISTSSFGPPTHWKQIYLPALAPITVRRSETVRLTISSDSRPAVKINVAWKTEILDAKGKTRTRTAQDMRTGYVE
ncbi:methyltransferase domain-containing protein [Candidatus Peregrinibacteria bacterium]|nr:methyltransferase domain-containing protein [Candidatus Peregrinibacteria bacterium]